MMSKSMVDVVVKQEPHEADVADDGVGGEADETTPLKGGIDEDGTAVVTVDVRRHSWALASLCVCIFVDAYLMVSVFPYGGFMALHLLPASMGVTKETVGRYAGFLSSSFMFGRLTSSYAWSGFADRYGRKFTQRFSLACLALLSLLFGVSSSFPMACATRFVMGFMDCMVTLSNTIAMDISHGVSKLEHRSFALVIGIRSWGFLVGPAVGGLLAQPLVNYPGFIQSVPWLSTGWRYELIYKYPFVAPSIVGAMLCLLAIFMVHACQDETLREDRRRSPLHLPADAVAFSISSLRSLVSRVQGLCGSKPSKGITVNGDSIEVVDITETERNQQDDASSTQSAGWESLITRYHLVTSWLFCFFPVFIDEAFPLFAMSLSSGLALHSGQIGQILSGAGLIYVMFQYMTYMCATKHMGLYNALVFGCAAATFMQAFIPVSLIFGPTITAFVFLSLVIGIAKVNIALFLSGISVAVNQTVTKDQRARMNGLLTAGNAGARSIAPIVAGFYVSFCYSSHFPLPSPYDSMAIWFAVPIVGIYVIARIRYLKKLVDAENIAKEANKEQIDTV